MNAERRLPIGAQDAIVPHISMHIFFVTNSVITKHATMKRAFGLTPGLQARGCRVTICLEDHPDNRREIAKLGGCTAHYYRKGAFRQEYQEKAKIVGQCDCDVVHICGLGWRNALMQRGNTAPFVMDHVELESSLRNNAFLKRGSQLLLEWGSLFAYKNTVVASDYLQTLFKTRARRLALSRRMIVLPYAADVPSMPGLPGTNQSRRLGEGKRVILYMGGLYKGYGCFEIVEALRGLLNHRQDWHAILLGRGPEQQRISEAIKRLGLEGRVELPGYAAGETLNSYLASADVFLCPLFDTVSDWARCPGKTYIYMMYGKPIVTCRIGETHKALGSDGFYYEPGSIESMTQAMNSAVEAAQDWRPGYDPAAHTWDARAETYLRWLRSWIPQPKQATQYAA
jgi:glycosyltransferase involved in cell wall biosynthesis